MKDLVAINKITQIPIPQTPQEKRIPRTPQAKQTVRTAKIIQIHLEKEINALDLAAPNALEIHVRLNATPTTKLTPQMAIKLTPQTAIKLTQQGRMVGTKPTRPGKEETPTIKTIPILQEKEALGVGETSQSKVKTVVVFPEEL